MHASFLDVYKKVFNNFQLRSLLIYIMLHLEYCHSEQYYGNPCQIGWYYTSVDNTCTHLSSSKRNWKDSQQACRDIGAELMMSKDTYKKAAFHDTYKIKQPAWIGAREVGGKSTWVDDTVFNQELKGKPPNTSNTQQVTKMCVTITTKGFNRYSCAGTFVFVCELYNVSKCSTKNGGCSHICIDHNMTRFCDCKAGYKLLEKTQCKVIESETEKDKSNTRRFLSVVLLAIIVVGTCWILKFLVVKLMSRNPTNMDTNQHTDDYASEHSRTFRMVESKSYDLRQSMQTIRYGIDADGRSIISNYTGDGSPIEEDDVAAKAAEVPKTSPRKSSIIKPILRESSLINVGELSSAL